MSTPIDPITALTQNLALAQQIEFLAKAGLSYTPPPPIPDVLPWLYPKPGKATRSTMVRLLPDGRIAVYYPKTSLDWPMDVKVATNIGIYFRVTDNQDLVTPPSGGPPYKIGWPPNGTPKAYRLYTTQNPSDPSGQLGNLIMPRYYDPAQGRILAADCLKGTGQRFTDCGTSSTSTLGRYQSFLSLLKGFSFGGDLGVQDSLTLEYYYTLLPASTPTAPLFKSQEIFRFTMQSGWVQWENYVSTDGKNYILAQPITAHNKYVADYSTMPIVPCSVVL